MIPYERLPMKKRLDLELWHEGCWMLEVTRTNPGVELVLTDICYDGADVLATVVIGGNDDLEAVAAEASAMSAVRSMDVLESDPRTITVHVRYDATGSIYAAVVDSSMTPIGHVTIAENREQWTLLAEGGAIGASMGTLDEIATIDVQRVIDYRPTPLLTRDVVDEIRQEMSAHQIDYLLSALEEGYYGWPREISAKDLAGKHDVSGPTALEHLRKGEGIVLATVLRVIRDRERTEAPVR